MNRDDILKAASEAGLTRFPDEAGIAEFEAFAQAIEAHVREELAAICEAHGNERLIIRPMSITDDPWKVGVFDCVELIRGDYKL